MRARQHAKRHLLNAVPADDTRYASFTLKPVDQLAAFHPEACDQQVRSIEIAQLASYPLLLLDNNFVFRRTFDAACRLARIEMNIKFESRTPHTLMAMAEDGHGVAIIPTPPCEQRVTCCGLSASPFRARRCANRSRFSGIDNVPCRAMSTAFCDMLADYMKDAFPVTRPSEPIKNKRRIKLLAADKRRVL